MMSAGLSLCHLNFSALTWQNTFSKSAESKNIKIADSHSKTLQESKPAALEAAGINSQASSTSSQTEKLLSKMKPARTPQEFATEFACGEMKQNLTLIIARSILFSSRIA